MSITRSWRHTGFELPRPPKRNGVTPDVGGWYCIQASSLTTLVEALAPAGIIATMAVTPASRPSTRILRARRRAAAVLVSVVISCLPFVWTDAMGEGSPRAGSVPRGPRGHRALPRGLSRSTLGLSASVASPPDGRLRSRPPTSLERQGPRDLRP